MKNLMEKYLDGEELTPEEIKSSVRQATLEGHYGSYFMWICL